MSEAFKLAPHEWALLRSLLDEALALPPARRADWLEALDDARSAGLKPRLRALLANAADAGDSAATAARLLDTLPKVETGQFAPLPGAAAEQPGDTVGPYRLIRELGSGGMGSVWLAERTDMLQGRQVALKLPHGAWKRAGLAERMAREREILATLEHPNIARLYDAGLAADGQPWLALEYVQGERIDAWCCAKNLPVPARLRLFLQVAQAVAYAHAQLVVHRDLKPANILVSNDGGVKLLDFGIAKLVQEGVAEETELTRDAGRALTPEYASPEQVLGRPLGTASDIYSLGVLLFELLADERPYRLKQASRAALEVAIAEAEVPRPSSVAPAARRAQLRGDLDTIVLKALKREPAERYATVSALADDVMRHLEHRPLLASPDSGLYQLRKFFRRHRVAVGAASGITVALLVGAAVSVWQARQARLEQLRAEAVKAFVTGIISDADVFNAAVSKPTVEELMLQARDRLQGRFVDQPALRVELLTLIGVSLGGLTAFDAAERVLQQALDEGRPALDAEHPLMLRARLAMAEMQRLRGRAAPARAEVDAVLAALRRTSRPEPRDLIAALRSSMHLAIAQGRHDDAQAAAREVIELTRRHIAERDPLQLRALSGLALTHNIRGEHEPALAVSRDALRLARDIYGSERPHARVIDVRALYGRALGGVGRYREAADEMAAVVEDARALVGPTSPMVAFFAGDVSRFRLEHGELRAALEFAQMGVERMQAFADPGSWDLAATRMHLGRAQLAMRQADAARATFVAVHETLQKVRGPAHATTLDASAHMALALAWQGRRDEAAAEVERHLAGWREGKGGFRFRGLHHAGIVRRLTGDRAAAIELQRSALASLGSAPGDVRLRSLAATELALLALDGGDPEGALRELHAAKPAAEAAVSPAPAAQPPSTPDQAERWLIIGRAELALRRPQRARAALEQADAFWRDFDPTSRWAGEAAYWLARGQLADDDRAAARAGFARAARLLAASPWPEDALLLRQARITAGAPASQVK
jgi:serine/threonine-protein kinase